MIKEFTLQGLGCANCAAKIEEAVKKTDGISSASINFMTAKLRVETVDKPSMDLFKTIEQIVHSYEPDVLVLEKHITQKASKIISNKSKIIWLATGAATFFAGILFEFPIYINSNIAFALLTFSYLLLGTKVIFRAVINITKGKVFDENFLMAVATIGAFAVGEYSGAVAVMLFYQVGEFFQELAVQKSKKNISDLMDIRPDYANLQADGKIERVSPETVNIGDTIIVRNCLESPE